MNDQDMHRDMANILGELENLFAADDLGAIQVNIVRRCAAMAKSQDDAGEAISARERSPK